MIVKLGAGMWVDSWGRQEGFWDGRARGEGREGGRVGGNGKRIGGNRGLRDAMDVTRI